MPQIKPRISTERFSKSRAAKASLLTGMTVAFFLVFCYHVWWAMSELYSDQYHHPLSKVAFLFGGLALNAFVSVRILLFFETRLLSDGIDADHKKYI